MAHASTRSTGEGLQKRIAERAYSIWESEGRPHGSDVEHWLKAEREIAARTPKPSRSTKRTAAKRSGAAKK